VRTRSRRQRRLGRPHPASKRESGNTDRNRCFRPHVVSVRLRPTGEPGWSQYNVEVVPKTPAHNGLVRFRNSLRWCGGSTAGQRWHHIPFIDHVGQIHATSLAKWRCTAPQLFATITSTVFKRLWGQTRYGPIKDRCKSGLLYKVAQVYTITNDDSFFRRSLSMLARQRHTELGKFVYYKIKNLDANNRFLYDQALYGALWFQSRQDRCPGRVLSNQMIEIQRNEGKMFSSLRCHFDRLMVAWARVYSGASAHPNGAVVLPKGLGQPFFRG